MTTRTFVSLLLLSLAAGVAVAQKATPSHNDAATPVALPAPMPIDTALTPSIPFTPLAVTMYGYTKRLPDARETFFLRNETARYRISRVLIKIVYFTTDGQEFHTREELVNCDLAPGASRMIAIKSFDRARAYYFHATPPQRANAIPYRIRYDILRYDVVVE